MSLTYTEHATTSGNRRKSFSSQSRTSARSRKSDAGASRYQEQTNGLAQGLRSVEERPAISKEPRPQDITTSLVSEDIILDERDTSDIPGSKSLEQLGLNGASSETINRLSISGGDSDYELRPIVSHKTMAQHQNDPDPGLLHPLERQISALSKNLATRTTSHSEAFEAGSPTIPIQQSRPSEFPNFLAEITCILVCTTGQLLFASLQGDIVVNIVNLVDRLGLKAELSPWLNGSFLLANGLSVVVFGSLADLAPPRMLVVAALAWLTLWDIVGVFTVAPSRMVLFFITRAMQGLAVGVLVSSSMSILGRIYNPGIRKTRVFSVMAAGAPFGFWLGAIQGGLLSANPSWIFGSNAMICAILTVAAYLSVPVLTASRDSASSSVPSVRNFDFLGAACTVAGCACLLFGLTQGSAANWSPYTYALIVVGLLFLVAFFFVERRVQRPLIPSGLWLTPGFRPLVLAYFLGFGAYLGAWQFFAIQFWIREQHASPIKVALYLTPNAIVGFVSTWIVAQTLHKIPGHWIFSASMIAYALGPVFFLPQTSSMTYWALSMPGVALASFGPDMSFAAASVFITSSVPRSYQGSAGSVLVTVQNLSAAVITAVASSITFKVDHGSDDNVSMEGLRASWWFALALALSATFITIVGVRIPKSEEKEHIT